MHVLSWDAAGRRWLRRAALAAAVVMAAAGTACGPVGTAPSSSASVTIQLDAPADDPSAATIRLIGLPDEVLQALADAALANEAWSELFRVTVKSRRAEAPADIPAVLGTYEIEGRDVRFRPMFTFDRGRQYAVTFDPAKLPPGVAWSEAASVVSIVGLERADVRPTTVVDRVYPTTGRLPENQLKLYIHFSAPMSDVDGLEHIRLLNEAGDEVEAPFLPLGAEF